MKKAAAPTPMPKDNRSDKSVGPPTTNLQSQFLGAVLGLSWRLAIVVLVPVVGGYKLDQHFRQSPTWTISGFLVAIIGVYLLLRQILRQLNEGNSK